LKMKKLYPKKQRRFHVGQRSRLDDGAGSSWGCGGILNQQMRNPVLSWYSLKPNWNVQRQKGREKRDKVVNDPTRNQNWHSKTLKASRSFLRPWVMATCLGWGVPDGSSSA
jgi:hypothetical protein